MGMESDIKSDMSVDFVGPYQPTKFSFVAIKPSDLAGFESVASREEVVSVLSSGAGAYWPSFSASVR